VIKLVLLGYEFKLPVLEINKCLCYLWYYFIWVFNKKIN